MSSPQLLRDKARQCTEIAQGVSDGQIVAVLHKVASWFEAQASAGMPSAGMPSATAPTAGPAPAAVVAPGYGEHADSHVTRPRSATRRDVRINATLRRQGESRFNANVADLSESGFRVESHYLIPMGAQVWLTLPGLAAIPAIVAWSSGHSLGCRFETPLHPAVLDRVIIAAKTA